MTKPKKIAPSILSVEERLATLETAAAALNSRLDAWATRIRALEATHRLLQEQLDKHERRIYTGGSK